MNKVELEGRLGADPEVKYTDKGMMICTANLATSNDYKPKGSDEWVKKPASWHKIVAFDGRAEALANFKKGDKVKVVGKIQYREWHDKEGNKRISTEIHAWGIGDKNEPSTPPPSDEDTPPF